MPLKNTREVPAVRTPPEAVPAVRTGPAVIAEHVKLLPASPGVYRMIDASGDVIYVGKARSLKARVSNYTRLGGHTNRIARMIAVLSILTWVATAAGGRWIGFS